MDINVNSKYFVIEILYFSSNLAWIVSFSSFIFIVPTANFTLCQEQQQHFQKQQLCQHNNNNNNNTDNNNWKKTRKFYKVDKDKNKNKSSETKKKLLAKLTKLFSLSTKKRHYLERNYDIKHPKQSSLFYLLLSQIHT